LWWWSAVFADKTGEAANVSIATVCRAMNHVATVNLDGGMGLGADR
jgi:hypothetical protein